MNTQATKATPVPLASASPVGEEERADLELMLGVKITDDWPAIRQCLRCITQGRVIDAGEGEDDKPFVRDLTAEELAMRPRLSGRAAVRSLVSYAKLMSMPALEAARMLAFTAEANQSRREWDAWWAKVEADRAERRAAAEMAIPKE